MRGQAINSHAAQCTEYKAGQSAGVLISSSVATAVLAIMHVQLSQSCLRELLSNTCNSEAYLTLLASYQQLCATDYRIMLEPLGQSTMGCMVYSTVKLVHAGKIATH